MGGRGSVSASGVNGARIATDPQGAKVAEFESQYWGAGEEHAAVFDKDGNVISVQTKGTRSKFEYDLTTEDEGVLADAVLTHNHPSRAHGQHDGQHDAGGPFSVADLRDFAKNGYREYRATASEGTYSLRWKEGVSAADRKKAGRKFAAKANKELNNYAAEKHGDAEWAAYKSGKKTDPKGSLRRLIGHESDWFAQNVPDGLEFKFIKR